MGTHPIFESDFDCLTDCMIQLTEFIVSVNFPVQMRIIFAMDDSSPIVDISAANALLRNISLGIITNFGAQVYYNFHNFTPVIIATSPLSNALLTSPRLFRIVEIALTRIISNPNMVNCVITIHPSIQASLQDLTSKAVSNQSQKSHFDFK